MCIFTKVNYDEYECTHSDIPNGKDVRHNGYDDGDDVHLMKVIWHG